MEGGNIMAWMIGVDKTIIANDTNSKATCTPDLVCLHTIVGSAPASAAHFSTSGLGKIWQHRDTTKQSAANYNGNGHIIAIENEDRGGVFPSWNIKDGHAVPGFTSQQIESIAQICAWANKTHGIPLVQCPNSKRGSRGIAYHRQGISGNWAGYAYSGIVAGGEVWTTSPGKVCPGDRRISQIPQIIERAKQIAGLGGGEIVTPQDIDAIANAVWAKPLWHPAQPANGIPALQQLAWTNQFVNDLVGSVGTLLEKVNQLETELGNVSTPNIDEQALATALINAGLGTGLSFDQVVAAVKQANQQQWAK